MDNNIMKKRQIHRDELNKFLRENFYYQTKNDQMTMNDEFAET